MHTVPDAVSQIRALGCAADAVRVTWLAPPDTPRPTHYTLYTRELGKYVHSFIPGQKYSFTMATINTITLYLKSGWRVGAAGGCC